MAKLKFFDCNCFIGRIRYPAIYDISDAAGLLREMETAGVEEALVYHIIARDGHPPLGNELLLKAIRDYPMLHPVWVVLPHHTGEMPPPKKLLQEMRASRVKAVRIYPTRDHHSFSVKQWCAGDLLGTLEKFRIPLILDLEILSWDQVHGILNDYRKLPVIAANCTYRHDRFLYPLFEKFDNLFVELSRFMGTGVIEDIVQRFGSGRLLFGTNMPHYTGTAMVALLTYAEIDQQAKQAIAGGNLARLLKEVWK